MGTSLSLDMAQSQSSRGILEDELAFPTQLRPSADSISEGSQRRKRLEGEEVFRPSTGNPSQQLWQESSLQWSPFKGVPRSAPQVSESSHRNGGGVKKERDCRSPRARYNSALITRLQRTLELDPEADLTPQISSYSTERLNTLRRASQKIIPNSNVRQDILRVEPRIPEPCGSIRVIWPLTRQVESLISPDLSNQAHQILSKWVVKISASIVVKFAPDLDIGEYQTMLYVWSQRGCIPIPEPLGAFSIGTYNYLFMSYIEGDSLASHWNHLSPALKSSIQSRMEDILRCLRKLPLPSKYLGSGEPPLCKDLRRHTRTSKRSISNEREFRDFILSSQREQNPVYHDLITSVLETNHAIVMTHGDLRAENIIVSQSGPDKIEITGLVDWELSGAYPEYWEYVKALEGVTRSSSDWYSYLPVATIGKHVNAWAQECLIDRLVL